MKSKSAKPTDYFWSLLPHTLRPPSPNQISSQQIQPTPLEKFHHLYLKREDQSPTHSHKFRALISQLSQLKTKGARAAVLSSSGNAALAAAFYAPAAQIKIFLLLATKTPPAKLAALAQKITPFTIPILSPRPIRLANYLAAKFHLPDLRPSRDPQAAQGFQTLGLELYHQNPQIQNIFSYFTSGASLTGILAAYRKIKQQQKIPHLPRLFGVYLENDLSPRQFESVTAVCQASKGQIVKISEAEFLTSRQKFLTELKEQGLAATSDEGLASLNAAIKIQPPGKTVVILTGAELKNVPPKKYPSFNYAENLTTIQQILTKHGYPPN